MNNYTEGTIQINAGRKLYYIYIEHFMKVGFYTFSELEQATQFKAETIRSLEKYGAIFFDRNLTPPENIMKAYTKPDAILFSKIENKEVYVLNG